MSMRWRTTPELWPEGPRLGPPARGPSHGACGPVRRADGVGSHHFIHEVSKRVAQWPRVRVKTNTDDGPVRDLRDMSPPASVVVLRVTGNRSSAFFDASPVRNNAPQAHPRSRPRFGSRKAGAPTATAASVVPRGTARSRCTADGPGAAGRFRDHVEPRAAGHQLRGGSQDLRGALSSPEEEGFEAKNQTNPIADGSRSPVPSQGLSGPPHALQIPVVFFCSARPMAAVAVPSEHGFAVPAANCALQHF